MRESAKLLSKNITKKFFFLLLEGGFAILPYRCCGYLPFVIEKNTNNGTYNNFLAVDFMVFASEVITSHHISKKSVLID